ncbi:MAG: NAD-dependent protein deacylase, partial [Lachnospiraceae bacterium]|nr:NAD-dependent protein deacylase [Lachnospiraceae bacterium]
MPEITFKQLAENAPFEDRIARVNEIFKDCNAIVFFGGAGVSTASGIPDFRGKNGLYSKPDPEFIHYQPE